MLATVLVIGVNAAANIVPINGINTGEMSANYPTGFTPAGWVFSIWSLIYIGLIAFGVYAARASESVNARLRAIEAPYLVSCVANAAWIFMWHYELIAASFVLMVALLLSLLLVYVRLGHAAPSSRRERWCVDMPFSLYLGWITTATLANLAAWFYDLGVYPFGLAMEEWALLTVVTATGIYSAAGVQTRDAVFTAVFAWASLGIVLQTLPTSAAVRFAAAAGCAVAVVVTLVSLLQPPATNPVRARPA